MALPNELGTTRRGNVMAAVRFGFKAW